MPMEQLRTDITRAGEARSKQEPKPLEWPFVHPNRVHTLSDFLVDNGHSLTYTERMAVLSIRARRAYAALNE